MEVIKIAFHIVAMLLAILAAVLLLFVNQERKHSNRLLAFILIFLALQDFVLILLFSKLMLQVPWLLRIAAPTTFLIAPAAFIYCRSVLKDELTFQKHDWLLLVPALLTLVNFIPFYLLPVDDKIAYLNKYFYNDPRHLDSGRGILPSSLYYIIRICWSAFFLFANFRSIVQFKKTHAEGLLAKNKILLSWLFIFNVLLIAVLTVAAFKAIIPVFGDSQLTIADILLGATILFICLQLFFRPQILYGVFKPLAFQDLPVNEMQIVTPVTGLLPHTGPGENPDQMVSDLDAARYKKTLEHFFETKKPFLMVDYTLDQLVNDLKIPRYLLSAFINREYGMGFREFLNRYRVEYMIANLDRPEWQQFTLEAIALECGFSSRITFFKNFKHITGSTPSEYVKSRNRPKYSKP